MPDRSIYDPVDAIMAKPEKFNASGTCQNGILQFPGPGAGGSARARAVALRDGTLRGSNAQPSRLQTAGVRAIQKERLR